MLYITMFRFSDKEYFLIGEAHPCEIIHIVIGFPMPIDIGTGEVVEAEFFLFQDESIYFLLGFVFAHDFQKNGPIAMKNGICFLNHFSSGPSKFEMVFIFTVNGAKYFVRSSPEGGLAHFTGSAFHMLRIRAYFMLRALTVIIRY
ncbi:MAG: hypothetical protein AAGA10_21615 [Bacteroidota bacterium]